MKHIRKVFSLLLALVMVMGLATTVSADDNPTITVPNDGHTYEIYQIFIGDYFYDEEKQQGILSNVKWGANGTGAVNTPVDESILNALKAETDSESNIEKLDVIRQYVNLTANSAHKTLPDPENNFSVAVTPGYYLIKDVNNSIDAGENDAYTTYIVQMVDDVTITRKGNTPTVVKKVKDINDSTGTASGWQDSADYDIGDKVPFQLTAKLADNVEDYKFYKVEFVDHLSDGLTYDAASGFTVKMNNKDVTSSFKVTAPVYDDNIIGGGTLKFTCNDVKAFNATNNDLIVVEFFAKLNENAVIGGEGNPNTADLIFFNNPNQVLTPVTPGDSDDPDGDGYKETPDTGKTPTDKVIVFTYKVNVNKKDEANKDLPGAGFSLYKKYTTGTKPENVILDSDGYGAVKSFTAGTETSFTFSGLDDGEYKLVETTTPPGYNTVDPIYFKIEATHNQDDNTENALKLTTISGTVTGSSDGTFTFTPTLSVGSLSVNVENRAGTVLPETGGIGTTMLYIVGGILVLAAVVLLVTKKRMSSAE